MRLKRLMRIVLRLAGSWVFFATAAADTLDDYSTIIAQTDDPKVRVSFKDGSVERYRPWFVAQLTVRREQHGETSRPLQGAFLDTRECRWRIRGEVQRKLFVCTRLGCDSAEVQPSDYLLEPSATKSLRADRDPPSLAQRVARLQPDPCSATDAEFRAAVERIRNELVHMYEHEVQAGRAAVVRMLRALPGADSVAEDGR